MRTKANHQKRPTVAQQTPRVREYWYWQVPVHQKDQVLAAVPGEPRLTRLLEASRAARSARPQQPAWGDDDRDSSRQ